VKLIKWEGGNFVFQVDKREKRLLFEVLKLYPLIPTAHHRASKTANVGTAAECQKLLEDALAERTRENKRQLLAMLNQDQWFTESDAGYRLSLGAPQMDWLLQVLNDIRVGSWVILGEPDEKKGQLIELSDENARYYTAMEFCGLIQMTLLDAFERQN
jgi:hypothetical protein